ncbi:hypothetical protein F0562_030318 [Nyssa sinensis]|uniref:ABC transporter domain-containing protein n=1 Tax=Nyssa sinensis TaxID=561372 RepID=A0A5J5AW32_9ASTE|nr:hypothetical protein F0562_030318 [Nyssa sinensis]
MGIGRLAKEKARMPSMGQRKRLQLTMLLAIDRPIWLLDEPLVALDDEGVKLLEYIIAEHQKKGGIVIVATHLPIKIEDAMFLWLPPRFPRRMTLVDMLDRAVEGLDHLNEQTLLLRQIEKVVKAYKARFVLNISELGEDDQLMLNATWYFQSLKVPWYTTRALKGQGANYFLKQIEIPFGKTLDVIACGYWDPSSGNGNDQLDWVTRMLKASNSSWRIVIGFHPLVPCDENVDQMEAKQIFEPLHNILLEYGATAYLSGQSCADNAPKGGNAHISNAGPTDNGPYFTCIDQRLVLNKKIFNGFLLHRVSSLELVTYFVTLTGEVVHRIALQQRGKEVM